MKAHRIISVLLVSMLFAACHQSKVNPNDQSPSIEYSDKICVADFAGFIQQNTASVLSDSFLGGLRLIYSSLPKDTVLKLTSEIETTLQRAHSSWLVGLPSGDSATLTIQYWKGVDTSTVLDDNLHPYSEFEKESQAAFFKVGDIYCSVFIRSEINLNRLYLSHLENRLLHNYIALLHK